MDGAASVQYGCDLRHVTYLFEDKGTKELVKSLIERETGLIERWQQMTDEWKEANPGSSELSAKSDSTTSQTDHLDQKKNAIIKSVYVRQSDELIDRGEPANDQNSKTRKKKGVKK